MSVAVVVALILSLAATPPTRVAGAVPAAVGPITRIAWVPVEPGESDPGCQVVPPAAWACDRVSSSTHGVVVLVGASGISVVALGVAEVDARPAGWARIVRVTPGSAGPDDLRDLTIAARKPERPRARPQATRFEEADDESVRIAKLSDTVFWIAGVETNPDTSLVLEGPAIAVQRLPLTGISSGAPEDAVYWAARAGLMLEGRVHGPHGETDPLQLEVWEPLSEGRPRLDDETPAVRVRVVQTDPDGSFRLDRLDGRPLLLTAAHDLLGRARVWIAEPVPFIDLELTPPVRAIGRVLVHGLPAASALIRFAPDIDAFAAGADPRDYFAAGVRSGDDGRFVLPLPRRHSGSVWVALDDGASVRVAVAQSSGRGEVVLGDITVPDNRHLTVRVVEGAACTLVAIGPLGVLGLKIVRAGSVTGVYELDLPESGSWNLVAECGANAFRVDPPVVVVPEDRDVPAIDVRVLKSSG
jgi:hypothetical protein